VLERDDAVAVVHGPAELGYPLLSTPLVDIWATIEKAFVAGALSSEERVLLRDVAGRIFYKRLGIEILLETAVQLGLAKDRKESVGQELISHKFSQKSSDALEVLRAIGDNGGRSIAAGAKAFTFEATAAFAKLAAEQDENAIEATLDLALLGSVDELAAIGLILAEKEAQRRGLVLTRSQFEHTARRFRHRHDLKKFAEVQKWMDISNFEHEDYVKLIEDEFLLEQVRALMEGHRQNLASRVDRFRRGFAGLIRSSHYPYTRSGQVPPSNG
jgi:hypothetical protein